MKVTNWSVDRIKAVGGQLDQVLARLEAEGRAVSSIRRGACNAEWVVEALPATVRQAEFEFAGPR